MSDWHVYLSFSCGLSNWAVTASNDLSMPCHEQRAGAATETGNASD